MTTVSTTPRLFVTDYASYNEGTQFTYGHWVDLLDFSDADEFDEYLTKHFTESGIADPEIMFTDFEGFPRSLYSESYDTTTLGKIFVYVNEVAPEIEGFDSSDWINKHNEWCSEEGNSDDEILNFDDDFFSTYFEGKPMEAARATAFGSVNWSDAYIKFDGYANLKSLNDYDAMAEIDKDALITWMIEQAN